MWVLQRPWFSTVNEKPATSYIEPVHHILILSPAILTIPCYLSENVELWKTGSGCWR